MKIKNIVREKYMELCPTSTFKCESTRDIDDKILRAIHTGRKLKMENGKTNINYYHNCFVTENNKVVDLFIDRDNFWFVKEIAKQNYDLKYNKVLV